MQQFLILLVCVLSCVQGYYYQHHYKDAVTLVLENYMALNEAFRTRNATALTSLQTDDVEIIQPGAPPIKGIEAAAKVNERLLSDTGPKSLSMRFERLVAECGDLIIVRDSGKGISAEGKRVAMSGLTIFRIENGVAKAKLLISNLEDPPTSTAPRAEPMTAPRVRPMSSYHKRHYYGGFPGQPVYPSQGYRGYYNYHPYPGNRQYPTRPDARGHAHRHH